MTVEEQTQSQKLFTSTAKAFKAAEAYLAQLDKVEKAFAALDIEEEKMAREHKDVLAAAGSAEASRLLGEAPDTDPETLNADLMRVRDQQDRMAAAKRGLQEKKRALFADLESQAEAANRALSKLTRGIEYDLNEELKQAVGQVVSIINRYYALYSGSHYISLYKRDIFEMQIPSLVNGQNLFKPPASYHVRTSEVLAAPWKKDEAAAHLYERINQMGLFNRKLQSMEKSFLDKGGLAAF